MDTIKSELEEIKSLSNSVNIENQELSKEISALINSSDLIMTLVYSRRCLEIIVGDICESMLNRERGTEPMKGIIDKFLKEKLIPDFITTAMYNVNNNSTYGAHPKDFDKRQVRSTLIDLSTVFDWYFFEMKKLAKKEVKTEQKQAPLKEEIKNPEINQTSIKSETIIKPIPKSSSLKPAIIISFVVIAVAVGVYSILSNKSTKEENSAPPTNTVTSDSSKIKTNDTASLVSEATKETTQPATKEKPAIDKKEAIKDIKIQTLDLPDDIEGALKMLGSGDYKFTIRKASNTPFLNRFVKGARVDVLKDGVLIDTKTIEDFSLWNLTTGPFINLKVLSFEKSGDKIKALKIEYTDK